jgi:hypothetical protein
LSGVAFGQKTRIKFAPGKTSAVVTGTLSGYKSKRVYVIHVRAGQTMTTENVGSHHITLAIEGPPGSNYEQDMAADCHSTNEINPTDAGDYTITVTECMKADRWKGTFKLKVAVH